MTRFSAILTALQITVSWIDTVSATGACKPATWANSHDTLVDATPILTWNWPEETPYDQPQPDADGNYKNGDIYCRHSVRSDREVVDDSSCAEMVSFYHVRGGMERFLEINPKLNKDCSNMMPNTRYCVIGYIQGPVNADGSCGPPNGNAGCPIFGNDCCSAETWKCGARHECLPGACYSGRCPGHKVWTTDGSCGSQNEERQCAGKWGSCCSVDGQCGDTEEFCGPGRCQSGNCSPPDLDLIE